MEFTSERLYDVLKEEFAKGCSDFSDHLEMDSRSYALHFAVKVLYTVSPQSRLEKYQRRGKIWNLTLFYRLCEDTIIEVCTFKYSMPSDPKLRNRKLKLTVKQANLLAIDIFCRALPHFRESGKIFFTPLAQAAFNSNDISNMIKDLNELGYGDTEDNLILSILQSCEDGGHCLEHSEAAIAAAVIESKAQSIEDRSVRQFFMKTSFQQYISGGKIFNYERYKIFKRYTKDGVPCEYSPEKLRELYNGMKFK